MGHLLNRAALPQLRAFVHMRAMTEDWTAKTPPDLAAIEALAYAARDALPEPYRAAARQIALRIEDFAPEDLLHDLKLDDPFELTGLYDGIPLTEKSVMDQPHSPDSIWLFRRPILDEWAERGTEALGTLVGHILVHELAHHFGWSDTEIARIDRWWE
jgi:predicted Zn-dependent protease with MMP-like domain